jgi:alkylated DNA repair dioxygenase AlkB
VPYEEKFWHTATTDEIFGVLLTEISWEHQPIKLFGKTHLQPRLTARYGDFACSYLVMAGETQSHYQHSIPKAVKVESVRINLAFRKERKA